jgi:hypothetical protein
MPSPGASQPPFAANDIDGVIALARFLRQIGGYLKSSADNAW